MSNPTYRNTLAGATRRYNADGSIWSEIVHLSRWKRGSDQMEMELG